MAMVGHDHGVAVISKTQVQSTSLLLSECDGGGNFELFVCLLFQTNQQHGHQVAQNKRSPSHRLVHTRVFADTGITPERSTTAAAVIVVVVVNIRIPPLPSGLSLGEAQPQTARQAAKPINRNCIILEHPQERDLRYQNNLQMHESDNCEQGRVEPEARRSRPI